MTKDIRYYSQVTKHMKSSINSKRGYVTDQVLNVMESKFAMNTNLFLSTGQLTFSTDSFVQGTMFDVHELRFFRTGSNMDLVPESVKKAWVMFLADFCKWVSTTWRQALIKMQNINDFQFSDYLTVSDEALVMWIIECRYDKVKENVEAGNLVYCNGRGPKPEQAKLAYKQAGPQDSRKHLGLYMELYELVKKNRKKKKASKAWQDFFVDAYKENKMGIVNISTRKLPVDNCTNESEDEDDPEEQQDGNADESFFTDAYKKYTAEKAAVEKAAAEKAVADEAAALKMSKEEYAAFAEKAYQKFTAELSAADKAAAALKTSKKARSAPEDDEAAALKKSKRASSGPEDEDPTTAAPETAAADETAALKKSKTRSGPENENAAAEKAAETEKAGDTRRNEDKDFKIPKKTKPAAENTAALKKSKASSAPEADKETSEEKAAALKKSKKSRSAPEEDDEDTPKAEEKAAAPKKSKKAHSAPEADSADLKKSKKARTSDEEKTVAATEQDNNSDGESKRTETEGSDAEI